jgi:HAD superfamily hydrolase (TIGR01549 family)
MDNTLIHATKAHLKAYQLAFERHGLQPPSTKKLLPLFGMVSRQLVRRLFPSLTPYEVHVIVRDHDHIIQRETYTSLKAVKGVVTMLKQLKREGYRTAVVSNSRQKTILRSLKVVGISRTLFDALVGNEKALHPKPSPDEIHKAEHLVHLKASYMVGDTIYDIMAGKRAGVKVISVLTGTQSRSLLKAYKPDVILRSAADVARYLKKTI